MLLLLHLHLILRRDASHRPCLSAALQALTSIILIAIIIIILVQYAFTLVIGMHYCCCCCCFCRPLLLCSACFLIAAFPCLSHLIRRMCYSASIGLYQPSQPGPNSQTVSPLPSPPPYRCSSCLCAINQLSRRCWQSSTRNTRDETPYLPIYLDEAVAIKVYTTV